MGNCCMIAVEYVKRVVIVCSLCLVYVTQTQFKPSAARLNEALAHTLRYKVIIPYILAVHAPLTPL